MTYTYTYDEAGNRTFAKKAKTFPFSYLESWQNTYTYNADNQMITAAIREGNLTKDYTFTYDANGNMTAECFRKQAEVTYQYDTENRLTAVYDQQKLLMASTYDGDGNRAFQLNYNPDAVCGYGIGWGDDIFMPEHSQNEDESLTAEGQLFSYLCSDTGRAYDLTEYVNDTNREHTEVLTAYNINGESTESYSYAGNQRLSRNNIWTEARDVVCNETSYYQYDGRGSVTSNTWYNGMVTDVYQYDPYGQVTRGSTEHADFYGYNAESYNPNSGLEYLRARYYNANQGRFFQEDTYLGDITDTLSLNRYAYVKNSPLNYVDPSGHKKKPWWKVPTESNITNTGDYPIANPSNASPLATKEELKQMIGSEQGFLFRLMQKANNSKIVKDCRIFTAGVSYGRSSAEKLIDGMTTGKVLALFGNNSKLHTDDEFRTDYINAITKIYDEVYGDNDDFMLSARETFENGMEFGYGLVILDILQLVLMAGNIMPSGTQYQSAVVVDTYGNAYTVIIPQEAAGNLGAGVIIDQMTGEKDERGSETEELTRGKSRAPETGKPGSTYEQVDDKGNVMSRNKYGENGRIEYRDDLTGKPHFDKNTGEYLDQHRHTFKYNDRGQSIGETVTPIPNE